MEAISGLYRINRLALQVEMEDGRIMTFYCSPEHTAAASVTITTEQVDPPRSWGSPFVTTRGSQKVSISIEDLAGYIMTLRQPDPGHWEAVENRMELEQ